MMMSCTWTRTKSTPESPAKLGRGFDFPEECDYGLEGTSRNAPIKLVLDFQNKGFRGEIGSRVGGERPTIASDETLGTG